MPQSARVAPLPGAVAGAVRLGPIGEALRRELAAEADPELAAFYRARGYRPIWTRGWGLRPDARLVLEAVAQAGDDGLDPESYGADGLAEVLAEAGSGTPGDLARAEVALSRAAAGYLADLHTPRPEAKMVYADPAVAPPEFSRTTALDALAWARTPGPALAALRRMNPFYEQLRAALAANRGATGDATLENRLRINLERARALPAELGRRYILVDAAAQTLWLYEDGRAVDSMPVVVGKPSEPTPSMAGLVRYAVARPYWNVPADLASNSIAPKVLRFGPGWLNGQQMEVLSDWTAEAHVVAPSQVNWSAVARGRQVLRVRQKPGPDNMMGQVKFVFPNRLGVYLHDSPLRQFFGQSRRAESAGCVRLADAPRLARWLLADRAAELARPGAPETRIDLVRPVPVYIVYFTAIPTEDGSVDLRPDFYRRDRALQARLGREPAPA